MYTHAEQGVGSVATLARSFGKNRGTVATQIRLARFSVEDSSKLSDKELEVLRLLWRGYTDAEVGEILERSPRTVSFHHTVIIRKLGARTSAHMFRLALEQKTYQTVQSRTTVGVLMSDYSWLRDCQSIGITGGTGTLGHALVDKILSDIYCANIERIVIFSRDEVKQAQMSARIKRRFPGGI